MNNKYKRWQWWICVVTLSPLITLVYVLSFIGGVLEFTEHAEKRLRKRLGLKRKAVERYVMEAIAGGTLAKNLKGRFKRFYDKISIQYKSGNNTFAYCGWLFIVQDDTLITVYEVPKHLK